MSSELSRPKRPTAAWRLSGWTLLAFAVLLTLAFGIIQIFVGEVIRERSDAWLRGEAKVLGQVAERAAAGNLYREVVAEVAELATKEVPDFEGDHASPNESVIFLDSSADGSLKVWVGKGSGPTSLATISKAGLVSDQPRTIALPGSAIAFRIVRYTAADGSLIYLGLSEAGFQAVMHDLRTRLLLLWFALILSSFAVLFLSTKHMLNRIQRITETAALIGSEDLTTRLQLGAENDEISRLAFTLNHMLDRIHASMQQLHLITDSVAHDLKSPITAIRGLLEQALSDTRAGGCTEPVARAVEELDRLSDFLTTSLDVAEADASALRLDRRVINFSELLGSMTELYEPSMSEHGLLVESSCEPDLFVHMDPALTHRMLANLFDNEVRHLLSGALVSIRLRQVQNIVTFTITDDGPGFPPEVLPCLFQRSCKGKDSKGRGIGLAFVKAVVCAHGGRISGENAAGRGARIAISLPRCPSDLRLQYESGSIQVMAT